MKEKKALSMRHPIFYFLSVWHKRCKRMMKWFFQHNSYCSEKIAELPICVTRHQSLLVRKLGNSDIGLQYNKIKNLERAMPNVNLIIIKPGEIFSFWKLVGYPTKRKGYVDGMLLARGDVRIGIGGGLCQFSNLIYWMVLHTPLTVIERHHHGFDPFPDNNRTLPFGSGATIFYNYVDLQFQNNTKNTFQIKVWLTKDLIKGEIRSDQKTPFSYHIYEQNHGFSMVDSKYYRQNEIWRDVIDKNTGNIINKEFITKNFAEVRYVPEDVAHNQ